MLFYDFEVFKNDWLVVIMDVVEQKTNIIVNNLDELQRFYEKNKKNIWIGYNSSHYDQYILKGLLCGFDPYDISDFIINKNRSGWEYSRVFRKIKLNNFDVSTRIHSLKQLEGFLGNNIKESSVDFNIKRKLTDSEIEETINYCKHDVEQTIEVFLNLKLEFESQISLINAFDLDLTYLSKSKPQLSAVILGARKQKHDDEFEIDIPKTLKLNKYSFVLDWYKNPLNLDYSKSLKVDISGTPHIFAWGGLHGAKQNYISDGIFINVDVASYYPSLMIKYGYGSRNIKDPKKYEEIYNTRLKLKRLKDPKQQPYKIVLNSTYGAMKDKHNALYDPRQANNVCVGGQLLLLDLIEKLEPYADIIQSNTDGVLIKIPRMSVYDKVISICKEWERRTMMGLEYEEFIKVIQKDVNNYIIVKKDGSYKSKGAYVKKLSALDYDLPIINKALINYFINNVPVENTINKCDDLKEFQKVVKVSSKFEGAIYGDQRVKERVLRVFASRMKNDPPVMKLKDGKPQKIGNTPERCFILNECVNDIPAPRILNKNWYIEMAKKRIIDFKKGA